MSSVRRSSVGSTLELFPKRTQFSFEQLGPLDAKKLSDNLAVLRELIVSNEQMYPSIDHWFSEKVIPGLRSSERIAWLAYEGESPVASAILKRGINSKFCHLRIHPGFQDLDLGQMFFTQMTMEARHYAKEIHFTLPESLWISKRSFFESFGFSSAVHSCKQYRNGEEELACSAPIHVVQRCVFEKLPRLFSKFSIGRFSLKGEILISIKPAYVQKILNGSKLIEIRKKFSEKRLGARAVLYASSPQKALVGEAVIRNITLAHPDEIWEKFGADIGCSLSEFRSYVGSAGEISAIEFDDVVPYKEPLSLSQMSHLVGDDLRPPQSFCDLNLDHKNSLWATAVSVASLLHGRFPITKRNSAPSNNNS